MSWYYGSYGNVEGVGHDVEQNGARYIPHSNIASTSDSGNYIDQTLVNNYGYALGTIGTVGIAAPSANAEIYGIIPKGGAQKYYDQTMYTDSDSSTDYRYMFRVEPGKPGERFEVPYATHTDSSPSIGGRLVCGGGGSVKRSPAISRAAVDSESDLASTQYFAEGELRSNWVCVELDSTNKLCIIERV